MRISRFHMFLNIAEVAATRSTCSRANVGALVVKDNDIVSIGYNGPASGEPHCIGSGCAVGGKCVRSIHAEKNAVDRAIRKLNQQRKRMTSQEIRDFGGDGMARSDVYCTYSPCIDCARMIFNNYVGRFFYRYSYRDPEGLKFLIANAPSMGIYRITPSGIIISERSGNIVAAEDIR